MATMVDDKVSYMVLFKACAVNEVFGKLCITENGVRSYWDIRLDDHENIILNCGDEIVSTSFMDDPVKVGAAKVMFRRTAGGFIEVTVCYNM